MRLRERTTWLKRRRRAFQFQSPGACHAERRRGGRFEDDEDDDSGGNDGLLEAGRLGAPGGKEDLYKNREQVTNKSESLQKEQREGKAEATRRYRQVPRNHYRGPLSKRVRVSRATEGTEDG